MNFFIYIPSIFCNIKPRILKARSLSLSNDVYNISYYIYKTRYCVNTGGPLFIIPCLYKTRYCVNTGGPLYKTKNLINVNINGKRKEYSWKVRIGVALNMSCTDIAEPESNVIYFSRNASILPLSSISPDKWQLSWIIRFSSQFLNLQACESL